MTATVTTAPAVPANVTIEARTLVAIAINNLASAANALLCLPQKGDVLDFVANIEAVRDLLTGLEYGDETVTANANGGVDGTAKAKRPGGAGKGVEAWHATVAECKVREVDIFVEGTKRVCGTVELKARLAAKAAGQTTAAVPPALTEKQVAITAMITGFNRAMDQAEGRTTPHPLSDVTAPRTEQPTPAPVVAPAKVEPKPAASGTQTKTPPTPAAKAQCCVCLAKIARPAGSDPFARYYCGQHKPVVAATQPTTEPKAGELTPYQKVMTELGASFHSDDKPAVVVAAQPKPQATPATVTVPGTTPPAVQPKPQAPAPIAKPTAPKAKVAKLDPAAIPGDEVLAVTKKDELIRLCADYGLVSQWGSPPSSGTGAKSLLRQARMKATGK